MKKIMPIILVKTVIWNIWSVSSGDGNFCGSEISMNGNLLTFPLEIDCIHKPIYSNIAEHQRKNLETEKS